MRRMTFTLLAVGLVLGFLGTDADTAPATALSQSAQAAADRLDPVPVGPALYIVRLHEPALASYTGGIAKLEATSPRATGARRLDPTAQPSRAYLAHLKTRHDAVLSSIGSRLNRQVEPVFRYTAALNGFAVNLTPAEAAAVATLPGVRAVDRDVVRTMDTEVGPTHIGAPAIWNANTGTQVASRGEGMVVGIIDTGINSQHPSFAATDGDGYAHTNPYGAGVYQGWCATNPGFCNGKLIAAYTFHPNGGSPEDTNGHGSHVASIAGGNKHTASFTVGPAPYNIEIQGVAPRANIVAYKVCDPSCPATASIAAINSAILDDQVNVLNYSISGGDAPWTNTVDLAFLDAFNAGIFVSSSAGNSGPGGGTVTKTGPWNATVAATTINRIIAHNLDVTGPTTPPSLQGIPGVPGEGTALVADITGPIRYDTTNNNGCSVFPAGFFTGALALIQRGDCTFDTKVNNAAAAGATAVLVFQNVGGPPITMGGLTGAPPAVLLDLADGLALRNYVIANPTAEVRINAATSYQVNNDWQDIVAPFSSRGPSQFEILKPDFTAPGVNILAARAAGATPVTYGFMQGTSHSSPHGAGSAALLMALYPTWSPAEIRSALATSATGGLLKDDGATPSDPFDVGSGLLALGGAATVGLVLDETGANYAAADPGLGGDPKTLNQPSMVDYSCVGTCSWTRTVKSVLSGPATYTASSSGPAGLVITVTPNVFTIPAGGTQVLQVTADVNALPSGTFAFGAVSLSTGATWPGGAAVSPSSLPVVVLPDNLPNIDVGPLSLDATQLPDTTTQQDLTIENTGGGILDWAIGGPGLADNGPLITHPAGGSGGADASVLQTALSLSTFGFGHALASGYRVADDFTVPAGGWWVDSMTFFAYQNGSTTTSTINHINLQIWDGPPDDPGSTIVFGDTVTNRLAVSTWTDMYRVTDTAMTETSRPVMANVATMGVFLPAGTYWVDWQTGGTLASGPWAPPVTILGATSKAGANALQFDGTDWNALIDTGAAAAPQDLPFLVNVLPAWLTLSSQAGSNASGAQAIVTATFDSTGLAPGIYTVDLFIRSNDPDPGPGNGTDLVIVPVTLEVESPTHFTVTVLVGPQGGGTVTGGGPYSSGQNAAVSATPDPGWVFLHWLVNGVPVSTANPYNFTVTEDITLTAVFQQRVVEAIPTTGTLGLLLLLGMLLGVGVFVLRRMA